jgi:signal transduction histidine kinase
LDEQKRSFLRMVSHELRTPLNSIIGFSEVLASELCGPLGQPQYKEYAGHILQSGHKLLRLVNQVLEIARLEGHVTDLDILPEALDHAFDDVQVALREDIDARQATIVVEGEGRLPTVLADPRGLRTVLGNLLHNAIAFSPPNSTIHIGARESEAMIDIVIADEGEGIDPADIDRLMRPFEQGETALTRSSEGAGLGLPIARLYCEAMGGRLSLHARPELGLTAHVRLPRG